MEEYKIRMADEYRQTKNRYNKLHDIIVKYEAGTLEFRLNCPIEILKKQANAMGQYLFILEVRAEIEQVVLTEDL